MRILLLMIPISLLLLGIAIWAFVWAVRRGQFDDLETPALDIFVDEEAPRPPSKPLSHLQTVAKRLDQTGACSSPLPLVGEGTPKGGERGYPKPIEHQPASAAQPRPLPNPSPTSGRGGQQQTFATASLRGRGRGEDSSHAH